MADIGKLLSPFKAPKQTQRGEMGYDNPRENVDPQIKTKVIYLLEGKIEKAPSADNDIANKAYVDEVGDGTTKTLLTAAIDFAGSGDNTIVAADASNKIKVSTIVLTVAGETNITLKHGSSSFSGAMDFGGSGEPKGMVSNHRGYTLNTAVNEAFVINSSAAVQVSGYIIYFKEA